MRGAFSDALVHLAKAHPEVVLLTGDHGYALFDEFRRQCPDQYVNAGIAEQNMVGMAAGLARIGFRPIVYGLSAFVPIRVLEQIKLDVAHDNLPVLFIGDGAGFVYSHLGTSHQATEDIACTRAIPNLSVFSPGDRFEVTACMDIAFQLSSPVYLRLGKSDRGDVHHEVPSVRAGDLIEVRRGVPAAMALIATGSMLRTAVQLAEECFHEASVWSAPFIKPLDHKQVMSICSRCSHVIVLEEHSQIGGLGSAVAEIASESGASRVLRIGVPDRFSHLCGTYEYLLREHGLDLDSVASKIRLFSGG